MATHKQGILTADSALYYATADPNALSDPGTYVELEFVRAIPSLGGDVQTVDTTCLRDHAFHNIPGLRDYGQLEFTLLYDNVDATSNFRVLSGLQAGGNVVWWKVELPDGCKFEWSGRCAVSNNELEPNNAVEFTLTIFLDSDITITDPA